MIENDRYRIDVIRCRRCACLRGVEAMVLKDYVSHCVSMDREGDKTAAPAGGTLQVLGLPADRTAKTERVD
jgi:hypothetical protein